MTENSGTRKIAIACQGGGAHAAFTAGTLDRLLTFFSNHRDKYEIVALSGTSGGAICAYLTWCALSRDDEGEALDKVTVDKAIKELCSFWTEDNVAQWKSSDPIHSGLDALTGQNLASWNWLRATGTMLSGFDWNSAVSPYDWRLRGWFAYWRNRLREMLEKRRGKIDPEGKAPSRDLRLFIGAVNALTGEFWVFKSHKKQKGKGNGFVPNGDEEDKVSVDAVLASAALPSLFEATCTGEAVYWNRQRQHTEVGKGVYWDGLYSQNPLYAT
jgi:NTE family protein